MPGLYDENAWSSESKEFGEYVEQLFFDVLVDQMGFLRASRENVGGDLGGDSKHRVFAIARATEEEDWAGMDFWVYNSVRKGWFPIDLTASRNHADLKQKDDKERREGIYVVRVNAVALENAARGGTRFIDELSREVSEAIIRASDDKRIRLNS